MPIMSGAHPKALWPGVHAFAMNSYKEWPALYSKVFTVESSDKHREEDVETTGFGLPQVKAEGAATTYDTHSQGGVATYVHAAFTSGYIVTKEELADNLYKSRSFRRAEMLARSFRTAKEIVHANVLNRAFTAGATGGTDGVILCSASHPTLSGNQSNVLATAADLSEASLEDMLTQIMVARNSRGFPIMLRAKQLLIAPGEAFNAERILKSTLQNDTSNNAVNAVQSMGLIPQGAMVNPYLTDSDAWFLTTDVPNGLMSFQRQAYEFSQDNDFDTDNAKAKGYERYSVGWTEWRSIYGTPGA
ncbi:MULTISPECIES: hypothetical protein [Pseudomonadota]|uniref:phage major capsid protein n=1 Tax=Pseudomonadota TaxID=1224 RepID=UPI0026356509|nr:MULTISPECIES: hypothetical protein [Pseudomonadota]